MRKRISGSYNGQITDLKEDMEERKAFEEHLRRALYHLYDPEYLQQSPLADLFGVAGRYDTAAALRRILSEAVDALEPPDDDPSRWREWRLYEALLYRYVHQLSPNEVADQLGIGVRQLRREQRAALSLLADYLWAKFQLDQQQAEESNPEDNDLAIDPAVVNEELSWLRQTSQHADTDPETALKSTLDLAERVAAQYHVRFRVDMRPGLPHLAVHPVACRQLLLNLLTIAIPRASSGTVEIAPRVREWNIEIRIRSHTKSHEIQPTLREEKASLNLVHEIAQLCGGRLELDVDAAHFEALLVLPAVEQLPVLVIDDNPDTLHLLRRYVAGTRYRLITTSDPEQALDLIETHRPALIVLDVMMPQVDGWEVLSRLRQHPLSAQTPIIVCTILAQRDFALLMGASAFVHKPVTQQSFLAALDEQMAHRAPGSQTSPRYTGTDRAPKAPHGA